MAVVCASIVAVSQTLKPAPQSQSSSAKSVTEVSKSTAKKKTSPNLSPSEKQAFDLLESVHGQLGNFSAETQAYLLQEMAGAYASKNRPKQIALLKQALHAAGDIAETGSRYSEESQIITSLEEVDPKGLVSLENDASPRVRQQVREFLLKQDIEQGRMDVAVQRLCQWDTSLGYPYGQASVAIKKLSAEQSAERQAVFAAAMSVYRNSEGQVIPNAGFEDVVFASYNVLPPGMVLQGIDLLLSRAAKSDEKTGPVTVQFGGNGGDLNLSAVYDYMLFRFLPMLQELDPGKAKALLRDHDNVAALIKKYPDGMTSVAPGGSNYQSYSASPGETHFTPPDPDAEREQQQLQEILRSAFTNFDDALAKAQTLKNTPSFEDAPSTPRSELLLNLANFAMHRGDESHAMAAVKALVSAAQDLPPMTQLNSLLSASTVAAHVDDSAAAKQYLNQAMRIADTLYKEDAFGDPPNLAEKALWPSAAAWKATLTIAAHVDPGFALEQCASLPDPEIAAVEQVTIATVLLGQQTETARFSVRREGEDGHYYASGVIMIPGWEPPKHASAQ